MVLSCCVSGCKERAFKGSSVTFHSFPRDKVRRKQWETKIGRGYFVVTDSTKVCSKHFTLDCFETQFGSTCLKKTAVPTLFIPKDPIKTEITHKPSTGKVSEEMSVSVPEQGSSHPQMNSSNGEVTAELEHCVTWKIPNFFGLPKDDAYFLDSPEFELFGDTWHLRLLPNNEYGCEFQDDDEEEGYYQKYFEIWLVRLVSSGHGEDYYHITMGLVKPCGGEYRIDCWDSLYIWEEEYRTKEFDSEGQKFFGNRFSQEYYLFEDAHFRYDGGAVTFYCRLSLPEPCDITSPPSDGKEKELSSMDKWLSDLKKLFQSGAGSDLLVVVSGREFRAHKGILRTRSPVFDTVFEQEKESGKVVIEDLAPEVFQDFLDYMYSGNVEVFSGENVLGLYAAADKYGVQELKSEALEYMQRTLSVASFCDFMALALRHKETDLVDRAADFFKSHLTKIIVLEKWQAFLRDHNTAANELFIKALVPKDEVE